MIDTNTFQNLALPEGYSLRNNTIYKKTIVRDIPKIIRVCDFIRIDAVHQDVETMEQQLNLSFYTGKSGVKQITIPAEKLTSRHIEELAKYGVDVTTKSKNEVNEFLIAQRKQLQSSLSYKGVGWSEFEDQRCFALDKILVPRNQFVGASLDSKQYTLMPMGTHYQISDLTSPIGKDLADNVNLQLGIVLGMSAALIPIINDFNPDIGTLIYALKGQSTSGKTTTAQLAASVAGPISGDGSLFNSWMNTQNAVTIKLNNNFGIPLVYDELSVYRGSNLTSLLYNVSQGLEKARATKNGEIRPQKRWQTVVISTGEQSIIEKSSQNDGILARTLEFEIDHWTDSAEQSERIKRFATQNNGWWIRDFIEAIFGDDVQSGIDLVAEVYEQQSQIAITQLTNANLKERLAGKVAVLGTTAKLMNQKMGFAVDADEIQRLVIQYCNLEQSLDVGERAFEDVLQYLISNQKRIKTDRSFVEANLIGFFDTQNKDSLIIDVISNELKTILSNLGYEDTKIILRKWASKGHLVASKDRLSIRKVTDNRRETFYALKLSSDEAKLFVILSPNDGTDYNNDNRNSTRNISANFDLKKAIEEASKGTFPDLLEFSDLDNELT